MESISLPLEEIDKLPVLAYPSQREAAAMLDVSESTLSRSEAPAITVGSRGRRYRPSAILAEAAKHKRRSLNEVAAELIRYANEREPERAVEVRREVEEFFEERQRPPVDAERFLKEARQTLPPRLYAQVKRAYDLEVSGHAVQLVGESVDSEHSVA